jgi:hypothetical protein
VTFTELVTAVADRLNLTSTEATTRIGREINDRYRRVTSSIGLTLTRRAEVTAATVIGDPAVTFTCEKILAVFDVTTGNRRVLAERTFDEWRNANTWAPTSGQPLTFAISEMNASTVKIVLDPVPSSVFTLRADAIENASTLSGVQVPDFAADFHDVLMHGALADELYKMEKADLARQSEADYQARLSDLRMFIAKSAYLEINQGGRAGLDRGAYWPGYGVRRWR